MALLKDIKKDNGLKTDYHRIIQYSILKDEKKVQILIHGYIDKTYREIEKQFQDEALEIENVKNELEELMTLNVGGSKNDEIGILSEKVTNYYTTDRSAIRYATEVAYTLDYDDTFDYTFESVYNLLKKEDVYVDSEDV